MVCLCDLGFLIQTDTSHIDTNLLKTKFYHPEYLFICGCNYLSAPLININYYAS